MLMIMLNVQFTHHRQYNQMMEKENIDLSLSLVQLITEK